ncbi:hypothetical protein FPFC_020500 [Fructobacillus pseudoficulneus]|uniref:DUF1542 domain-containing protein n=1 Tax=Fructobacillus pseudoficulneus TaxID=220714 RepID=A0A3F3H889_9LACO|nr:DUF1542 domain-containing protein [Fructobacillus pseudoficulneus]GAP02603.1 hypothetical protein FPFC_020500 [Fructobacillus pseudoficulneus]
MSTGKNNIDATTSITDADNALTAGKAAVDAVQVRYQNSSDTAIQTAKDAANSAIDAAAQKAQATIDGLTPLSDKAAREAKLTQDVASAKQKINQETAPAAVTQEQTDALNMINGEIAAAQVKSAQDDATARLRAYADNAETAITNLPDLPADDGKTAKTNIEAAVQAGNQAISAANNVADVKAALTNEEKVIDGISATAQSQSNQVVADAKQDAENAIIAAAEKAKTAISNLPTLSDDEKRAKEALVDQDSQATQTNISSSTDTDQITQAKQAGINNINQDVLNSQLADAQKDAVARLAAYAQQVEQTIAGLPDLSPDQINQANATIDDAVKTWTAKINQTQSLADVQSTLAAAEKAINDTSTTAQGQSQQTVLDEKTAADAVIDTAAQQAKANLDSLSPLSDRAAREQQIDDDAAAAKTAIMNATNKTAITKAQTDGQATIATDVTNAQLKSAKEAADASLLSHGQTAKDAIAKLPDLTPDQIDQANKAIDAAVAAGQNSIDTATDQNGVATALQNGKAAVDAVQAASTTDSSNTVARERAAANTAIDTQVQQAKAAIDGLNPLSDKAAREAAIDAAAQAACQKIAADTNANDINNDRDKALQTMINDTAAAQLKSAQEAADAQLVSYGQTVKAAIAKIADLTPDQVRQADQAIDAAVTAGQGQIDAATSQNGVATALQNGEAAVDAVKASAQQQSDQFIAKSKSDAQSTIDGAGNAAKSTIDGLPALNDGHKAAAKAQIDQDAANAKNQINQATTAAAIKQALNDGMAAIQKDVVNDILNNTKADAENQLNGYAQAAKDKIAHLTNLTPEQAAQAEQEIDAIVAQGQRAIAAAQAAQEAAQTLAANKAKIDQVLQTATNQVLPELPTTAASSTPAATVGQKAILPTTSRVDRHQYNPALVAFLTVGLLGLFADRRARRNDK